MEYQQVRIIDIVKQVNKSLYLPAIQRELVWETDRIERLFDSVMREFPIGGFLYWELEIENRDKWTTYEFFKDYNKDKPHNNPANLTGKLNDIKLVIDGQQRISALNIGLGGSYRHFYYRWRTEMLYLDLLKSPSPEEENPEELSYGFQFRENSESNHEGQQLWYPVGKILDFADAEDAKLEMEPNLNDLSEEQKKNANRLIGRLHSRIHTVPIANFYLEKSQDYDKVLQIFIRTNSGGKPLEFSDMLLSIATAKWKETDARSAVHEFTDELNDIGNKFRFRKDFVLKACLYLTDLPVQYRVKNFTATNMEKIETSWDTIKDYLSLTVKLISGYGFHQQNIVAPLALLPIAYYLMKKEYRNIVSSSQYDDVKVQETIRKWFIFSTLKNAFGGSSDTTLTNLRVVLDKKFSTREFPSLELNRSLGIEMSFSDDEIDEMLRYKYNQRYTYLILSLLYPDKHWKEVNIEVDHIYPTDCFKSSFLKGNGIDSETIYRFNQERDTLCNLQLLTLSENRQKSNTPFQEWISSRDEDFRTRHLIPNIKDYGVNNFRLFSKERKNLIKSKLSAL